MKITLLTGFLGSGKTTLLKRLLREQNANNVVGAMMNRELVEKEFMTASLLYKI